MTSFSSQPRVLSGGRIVLIILLSFVVPFALLSLIQSPPPPSPNPIAEVPLLLIPHPNDHAHQQLQDHIDSLEIERKKLDDLKLRLEAHPQLKEHPEVPDALHPLPPPPPTPPQQLTTTATTPPVTTTSKTLIPTPNAPNAVASCPPNVDCRPLITGCGRSGTHFLADQIMQNNIPIKHERIGEAGSVSWIYGVPHKPSERKLETWFASEEDTMLRESSGFAHFPTVHVVRHPLKAIASLYTCFCGCGSMSCGGWADEPSWEWAGKHVAFSQQLCSTYRREGLCIGYSQTKKGRMIRAAEYWIGWNKICEENSNYRMQMEAYDLEELADAMGWRKYITGDTIKQDGFKRKSATVKADVLTWDELESNIGKEMTDEVRRMSVGYGYDS
jgi:hypothetical protein